MEGDLRCSIGDDSLSGRYEEIFERTCGINRTYFAFWSDEQNLASDSHQCLPLEFKERRLCHQLRFLHCTNTYP